MHHQPSGTILLTQTKYIWELLATVNITEVKCVTTPMFRTCKLSKHGDDKLPDPFLYRSVIGALKSVTLTQPNIVFCVNKVCQYIAAPLESH